MRAIVPLIAFLVCAPISSGDAVAAPQPTLEAEAGVASFNRDLAGQLRFGPSWGVRVVQPLDAAMSVALGYTGALTRVGDPRIAGTPTVSSHAGFAAARLTLPSDLPVRPFFLAGMGVMYSAVPASAQSVFRSDAAGIVPLGFGVLFEVSDRVLLGAQFQYLLTFDNTLERGARNLTSDLWNTSFAFGWRL